MPDIVQERGNDDGLALSALLGEGGALQHVRGDGHRLSEVFLVPAALKNITDVSDDVVVGQGGEVRSRHGCRHGPSPYCQRIKRGGGQAARSAARRERRPSRSA